MSNARQAFLSGDRPDDVALFLSDGFVDDLGALEEYGDRVEEGLLLVVDGETGRGLFETATGMQAMDFAGQAMQTDGEIAADLTAGVCPDVHPEEEAEHETRFVFSFVEEQNTDVEGLVAEGDAVFAYAYCTCGTAYSHRWQVGDRPVDR